MVIGSFLADHPDVVIVAIGLFWIVMVWIAYRVIFGTWW
jgi:hypothetical protein